MVIALNFKLTIKTVAYWTDAITILWDSFLQDDLASCGMVDTYPFLTFRGE